MTIAAADPWWTNWPEFLPGWLAFVVTMGTLIHKGWTRRAHLALGPDDADLRQALTAIREVFADIVHSGGHTRGRFDADDHGRALVRKIADLGGRRTDRVLRNELDQLRSAWEMASFTAPEVPTISEIFESAQAQSPDAQEGQATFQMRLRTQIGAAERGYAHTEAALRRLNKLERRTHGRT